MFHSKHTKQNKFHVYLTYLDQEYFEDFLNFLKTWNCLLQFYETSCLKDVLNCTPALD